MRHATHRPRTRRLIELAVVLTATALIFPTAVAAHSPHDVVTQVAVQHLQFGTPILYAVVRGIVVRTSDLGRTWSRVSAGIWRERIEGIAVDGAGALAVTDGHRVAIRQAGESAWEWLEEWDREGPHISLSGTTNGFVALSDGELRDVRRQDPTIANDVIVLAAGGFYCTADGTVAHVDGRTIGSTIPSPEVVAWNGDEVLAGKGPQIYVGSTLVHTASGAVTSIVAAESLILATLERDTCIVSTDAGETWRTTSGLTTDPQADEPGFSKPHFSASATFLDGDRRRFVIGGFDGFFFSDDGICWRESHGVLPRRMVSELDAVDDLITVTTYGAGLTTINQRVESPAISPPSKRLFSSGIGLEGTRVVAHASGVVRSTNDGTSWKSVPIGAGGSIGVRHRVSAAAKQAALEIGGRLGTDVLAKLRSVYKRTQSVKPQHAKLPAFGSVLLAPERGDRDWLLIAKPSGVFRSTDDARSFSSWLRQPPGQTLGATRISGGVVVLTPSSILVSRRDDEWIERRRPEAGPLDSIARWGEVVAVGTEAGLYVTDPSTDGEWDLVAPTGVATLATGAGSSLLVQFDDGSVERLTSDGEASAIAPPGTPIMRHCVSFPDMAPLLLETGAGVIGSDQYAVFELGEELRQVTRCTMLHPDRHELVLDGTWKLTPDRGAIGGVRATAHNRSRIAVWITGPEATIFKSPSSTAGQIEAHIDGRSVVFEPEVDRRIRVSSAGEVGERLLEITVEAGFAFEGLEIRHPEM